VTDIIKLALALFVISAIAGLAIGYTNKVTKESIAQELQKAEYQALKAVLPNAESIEKKQGNDPSLPNTYWIGTIDSGKILGYAFKVKEYGYSSDIECIVGLDTTGTILGVNILSQNETPGLGSRVKESASKNYFWNGLPSSDEIPAPWFTEQFKGLTLKKPIGINKEAEWHALSDPEKSQRIASNEITAITGATISTKAVVKAIEKKTMTYLTSLNEKN